MYRTLFIILAMCALGACSKSSIDILINNEDGQEAPAIYEFAVSGDRCNQYLWDFGDGNSSRDSVPRHIYYYSGFYEVVLRGLKDKRIIETKKNIYVTAPQKCLIRIETPYGGMIAEIFEETPLHRDNFVKLTEEGFYDELLFHRVIDGFMIQGGDPNSRDAGPTASLGSGGPGYQVDAEFTASKAHVKGAIAAARLGDQVNPDKKSSGSQFYIVHGRPVDENTLDQFQARLGVQYPEEVRQQYLANGGVPFLDQQYTVFGQVIEGLEIIDKIAATNTNAMDRPQENITMKISIIK